MFSKNATLASRNVTCNQVDLEFVIESDDHAYKFIMRCYRDTPPSIGDPYFTP